MARPKGIKISQLTRDNAAALTACKLDGRLPAALVITPTTATWPLNYNAAGALQTVLDAISKSDGTTRRALHAPRRKLEKLVRPGTSPVLPPPDPPKARKTKNSVACQAAGHGELVEVGTGRAKCLDCGLIVDRPTPKPTRQGAARTRRKPAAPAQAVPAGRKPTTSQKATLPAYGVIRDGSSYLVVQLEPHGVVLARCGHDDAAELIVSALNERTPR